LGSIPYCIIFIYEMWSNEFYFIAVSSCVAGSNPCPLRYFIFYLI
jgi:hypothetical protein